MNITTNSHRRELLSLDELPESARSDFDYVTGEDVWSPRFVHYRDAWWDTNDVDGTTDRVDSLKGWHSYVSTSFFDGIVIRYLSGDDDGFVVVGHYYE